MHALLTDQSPAAQIRASVTYNLIVEGVLAETGYYAYYNMLDRNNIMPGLKYGVGLLKRDEISTSRLRCIPYLPTSGPG